MSESTNAAQPQPASDEEGATFFQSTAFRAGVVGLIVALIGAGVSMINLEPDLSHLDVTVLSGSEKGQYRHVVDQMASYAKKRKGTLKNVMTRGSIENIERLTKGASDDETRFALVQDGIKLPEDSTLELVARLTSGEAVFFLAKAEAAERIRAFADLKGKTVGIGAKGSGTASLARQIFALPGFETLAVTLENHPVGEQTALVVAGKLDVAVFVIHEDGQLIQDAVLEHGLGIIALAQAEAVAHALGPVRIGRVVAGQYDPIRVLPKTSTLLLKVDTLVLSDGSASHSETVSLLTLLQERFPGFLEHNRTTPNATGLAMSSTSRQFFEDGGPAIMDQYAPWLVDLFPFSNLVHFAMVISVLFNLMGTGNKFCLWRIDVRRIELEGQLREVFGRAVTVAELETFAPIEAHRGAEWTGRLDGLIRDLDELFDTSRRQSVGVLVPMGGEMSYRYQETLVAGWVGTLRGYRERLSTSQS
jgi:hypothetical protein